MLLSLDWAFRWEENRVDCWVDIYTQFGVLCDTLVFVKFKAVLNFHSLNKLVFDLFKSLRLDNCFD